MQTFQRQSLDRSVLENVAIGDGSAELRGRVRYDHDPEGLSDALVAGSQGKTLRYVPDLSDPDVDFQCDLVAPLAPFGLELDPQRGILGDHSVELVLRQTDQGSFDPLYHGSAVLFSYRAGGSLEASSSFGRVTSSSEPATFAALGTDGGGYGTLSTALSNQARIHWMSTASSVGPRTFPTLLLEDTRFNQIKDGTDIGSWSGTAAASSAQKDPAGSTSGWRIEDSSTTATESRDSTTFNPNASNSTLVMSFFAAAGSTPSTAGDRFHLIKSSDTSDVITLDITWSSGIPTESYVNGSSARSPELWRDGFYRFEIKSTGFPSSSESHFIRVDAAGAGAVGDIGDVFFFGPQMEQ